MPVNLNTFVNMANSVKGDQSLYIKHDQLKDTGRVGSHFHRAETFRSTTKEFVKQLTKEFGTHMGEIASHLLKSDIDAGKPLKASTAKAFIELGRQHAAKESVDSIRNSKDSMQAFLQNATGKPGLKLGDAQYKELASVFRSFQNAIINSASDKADGAYGDLEALFKENKLPFLRNATDLILHNTDSGICRMGYPDNQTPEVQSGKMAVLKMIMPMDAEACDSSLTLMSMAAAELLRQDGAENVTCSQLFNTMFPPETTPTMDRPADDELDLFTPKQMQQLLKDAKADFTNNFTVNDLPDQSIFKGRGARGETALQAAKSRNIMPGQLMRLNGSSISLKDFPEVQADLSLGTPKSMDAAVTSMCQDMMRLGSDLVGINCQPPTVTFIDKEGNRTSETVGKDKYEGVADKNKDQAAYESGKLSNVTQGFCNKIKDMSQTPEQELGVMRLMNQDALFPVAHILSSMGDFSVVSEHDNFDYNVTQNADNSIDVTLTSSEELNDVKGKISLTYHVDTDGKVGLSDFNWERPSLDDAKEALVSCRQSKNSAITILNNATAKVPMTELGRTMLENLFMDQVREQIADVNSFSELPTADKLQAMAELPQRKDLSNAFQRMVSFCQTPLAVSRANGLPEAQRSVFCETTILMGAFMFDTDMNVICEHLDELQAARQNGPLTQETVWNILYNEDMPPVDTNQLVTYNNFVGVMVQDKNVEVGKNMLIQALLEKNPSLSADSVESSREFRDANAVFSDLKMSGMTYERCVDIATGNHPQSLSLEDIVPENFLPQNNSLHSLKESFLSFRMDLYRVGAQPIKDSTGKLPTDNTPPKISINLPGVQGEPEQTLSFNPLEPEGLDEREMMNYKTGKAVAVVPKVQEMLVNYCGEGHETQVSGALLALTQCGQALTISLPEAFQMTRSEHANFDVSVTADDDRNIHVKYQSLEGSPLTCNWEFVIEPDGNQSMVDFNMKRADA